VQNAVRELRIVVGVLAVPVVLLAERDQHLVEQRVAKARALHERAARDVVVAVPTAPDPGALAARRGPHADDGPRVEGVAAVEALARQTAATIQPVEMQHAAILNFVLGRYPVPFGFARTTGAATLSDVPALTKKS